MSVVRSLGIVDIAVHLPSYYVDQGDLAAFAGVEEGKLREGLGLREASVCGEHEDPVSLAMNAVKKLMDANRLEPSEIGRLEVGTESNWDGSKSLKTYLMDLFGENTSVCGCDTTNACYGGTNALFNAMHWMESSFYDGRYAIVVCTDAATYKDLSLAPLAGAASCAILLGPDPVLSFRADLVRHRFGNTADFCKPRTSYPYPIVNGRLSISIYNSFFSEMYKSLGKPETFYNHAVFHTPYPRLPEKNCLAMGIPLEKVQASLVWPRRIGNSYTSSLYVSLASLMVNGKVEKGHRILMYSFGSGSSSSLFVLEKVREGIDSDVHGIFDDRMRISAQSFVSLLRSGCRKAPSSDHTKVRAYSGYYLVDEEDGIRKYSFLEKE